MRAVLLDVPESLLEERRRKGHDVRDEVWEGVLHMVPPPSGVHQRFAFRMGVALAPLAKARGLVASHETGVFRPDADEDDYRIPDLVFARPENVTHRGVDGRAELVVEIRSPGDETYDKLDFYAGLDVQEVLVVDPEACTAELFVLRGDRLYSALPDAVGSLRSVTLGVTVVTVDGPALRLVWEGGQADVTGRA